ARSMVQRFRADRLAVRRGLLQDEPASRLEHVCRHGLPAYPAVPDSRAAPSPGGSPVRLLRRLTPRDAPTNVLWLGMQILRAALVPMVLLALACEAPAPRDRSDRQRAQDVDDSPYQAEVEEGLGASIALLIDTSGSMREKAAGDGRPKYEVAREALSAMLEATDAFAAKRPDFPIKIGV